MTEVFLNRDLEDLFTKSAHHYSNSVIFTAQNVFSSKRDLTIVRNLSYRIIFSRTADLRYTREIASQISTDTHFLNGCFAMLSQLDTPNELSKKFILHDLHNENPLPEYPVRGNILPGSNGEIIPLLFTPKINISQK